MKEFFFEKKGIYYRQNIFKPKRPTLFFVHGVSGSSSAWSACEHAFEKDYNVLSLDLRGHGKSARFPRSEDYTIPKFSEDLRELLKHCGVKKCVLISHSFGTFVALDFVGKYQSMVSSAVFISPYFAIGKMWSARFVKPFLDLATKINPHTHSNVVSSASRFTKRLFAVPPRFSGHGLLGVGIKSGLFLPKEGKHIDYSKYVNTGDWNIRRTIADVKNTGLWVFLCAMANAYRFNGENILKKIKVPILIIHGAKDTIIPLKYGVMMAEKIKNSKLVVLDDIDHIVVLNRSAKVIKIVKEFLGELKS
jgi:pimeloyl-ACP methyl ester carboxylesterase